MRERPLLKPCSRAVRCEWCGWQNGLRLHHSSLRSGRSAMLTWWSTSVVGLPQPGTQQRG